jgi:hypothetical protein
MGLLDAFLGKAQKRRADEAYRQSTAALNQGWDEGRQIGERYYGEAQGYLRPYQDQGRAANALYGRFLGLNGADDQRAALGQYATSDPWREFNAANATRALAQRYNAMGFQPGGGTASLGISRALLERGSQDYNSYLDRLAGAAQQGYGASAAGAALGGQYGLGLLQSRLGLGQAHAQNAIQYQNALAQADAIPLNNLFKIGELAVAAFGGGKKGG